MRLNNPAVLLQDAADVEASIKLSALWLAATRDMHSGLIRNSTVPMPVKASFVCNPGTKPDLIADVSHQLQKVALAVHLWQQ